MEAILLFSPEGYKGGSHAGSGKASTAKSRGIDKRTGSDSGGGKDGAANRREDTPAQQGGKAGGKADRDNSDKR